MYIAQKLQHLAALRMARIRTPSRLTPLAAFISTLVALACGGRALAQTCPSGEQFYC
jgi:hypothetical protein